MNGKMRSGPYESSKLGFLPLRMSPDVFGPVRIDRLNTYLSP